MCFVVSMEVDWAGTTGHCFYSCMVLKYEVVDSRLRVAVAEGFAAKDEDAA